MNIQCTYELPFSRTMVFDAWVSSATVIAPATAMDIDPQVGGHYRLLMETPEFTGRNEGTFSIVEPPERVRYTWEWNGDGDVTEVDVVFDAKGDSTVVQITHTGFTSEEAVASHRSGWDSYIAGFEAFLAAR